MREIPLRAVVGGVSSVQLGFGLMLAGMFLFALNDAIGKLLVATYSVGQVLLIRSAVAALVLLPFVWHMGVPQLVGVARPRLQALRVLFSTAEVFCFYWAVQFLALADVMTYWLAAPICVAVLSPFILREGLTWHRWAAIAVGFGGVLVALSPTGAGELWPTVVAMVGTFCFAMMLVTARFLRGTPDVALVFWQTAGAGLAGLVLSVFDWTPPTGADFALLGLLGVVAMLAHVCVTRALKLADAALVSPLQYTLLPWAVLFGWLMFGDVPGAATLLGGAIIIGSGLYLFFTAHRGRSPA